MAHVADGKSFAGERTGSDLWLVTRRDSEAAAGVRVSGGRLGSKGSLANAGRARYLKRPVTTIAPQIRGGVVQSEFYQLRRTAIKDISAYCAFLLGFIGSAPFAWQLLSAQLESSAFVRGLWYFFALVTVAGLLCGTAGLALGVIAGWIWEQNHRRRRNLPEGATQGADSPQSGDSGVAVEDSARTRPDDSAESPGLRLVPQSVPSIPDLTGRKLASIRFFSDVIEFDFGSVLVISRDNAVVITGLQRLRYPEPGSHEALCSLIGALADTTRTAPGDRLEIRFSADRHLIVQHPRSCPVTIANRS